MKRYFVVWAVEIGANTPEDAVSLARKEQLDLETTATFFSVGEAEGCETLNDVELWTDFDSAKLDEDFAAEAQS